MEMTYHLKFEGVKNASMIANITTQSRIDITDKFRHSYIFFIDLLGQFKMESNSGRKKYSFKKENFDASKSSNSIYFRATNGINKY